MSHGAPDRPTAELVTTIFALECFSVLVLLTLTEQFLLLPCALAAFAAAWCIVRL